MIINYAALLSKLQEFSNFAKVQINPINPSNTFSSDLLEPCNN